MHLIGRAEGDGRGFPELDSNVKAIHTKTLLFFLAEIAAELFQFCTCSLDDFKPFLGIGVVSDCFWL